MANFGNGGTNPGSVRAPALARNVIGVGALDILTERKTRPELGTGDAGRSHQARYPDTNRPPRRPMPIRIPRLGFHGEDQRLHAVCRGRGGARAQFFCVAPAVSIDPGQVYAFLILRRPETSVRQHHRRGTARPSQAAAWRFGAKVNLSHGQTSDVPINVNGVVANMFDGALCVGRRRQNNRHTTISTSTSLNPAGNVQASSNSSVGVFERARFQAAVANGQWKLRIRGQRIAGVQTVYWAAYIRGEPSPELPG